MSKVISLHWLLGLGVALGTGCLPGQPEPTSQIRIEGESAVGASSMPRSNASARKTTWIGTGGSRSYNFAVPTDGSYNIKAVTSNDGYPLESVDVTIDGSLVGRFNPPSTGSGGAGWNIFATTQVGTVDFLPAGTHTLTVSVSSGDGYGMELDLIMMDRL